MKRLGAILSLSVLIVLLSGTVSFAAGLSLEWTSPHEGDKSQVPVNMMVKMRFSDNISSPEAQKANKDAFVMKDPKGKEIPITPLYDAQKYPNEVWLLVGVTLEPATEYALTVSEDLVSSQGSTLDAPIAFHFSTRDTAKDGSINMALMAVMFVGMMVFTVWDTKRKLKKEAEKAPEENKVNPYKEAKRTGKSVEEIIAKTEKEKERQRARAARKQSIRGRGEDGDDEDEELPEGVKRVRRKRPISAAGGTPPPSVVAKRKAKEEAEARKREAARKKSGQNQNKNKGSKQQQKKKKR